MGAKAMNRFADPERIRSTLWGAFLIALTCILMARPVEAHHSYAMFDVSKRVNIEGTVREFQWTNPHSFLSVLVVNASGSTEPWEIEMGSPGDLVRNGWKRNSLKPGDKVTATVIPLRSGAIGGQLVTVTAPDGHVYVQAIFAKPSGAGGPIK